MTSDLIKNVLMENMPMIWDGKQCVLELKAANYNWRQMEWIGFYFEWKARDVLTSRIGGAIGPTFGSVVFDYEFRGIWDFKVHPNQSESWIYLNDVSSVNECISAHNHLAWIIACGDATYDCDGEFKLWHDKLKGKTSRYEHDRISRGAPSRKRKVLFVLTNIIIVEFSCMDDIESAINLGWLRNDMQQGQRNADGSDRNPKYGINIERLMGK